MAAKIPTDEQLLNEIRQTICENPKFKQCINCANFGKVTSDCYILNQKVYPYTLYCAGKHYVTAEEHLLGMAKRELMQQARECEKIEFLLAMAITSANMTTLFIEDFENRVKAAYKREKGKDTGRLIKKNLDLAEQMDGALDKIGKHLKTMWRKYESALAQYLSGIKDALAKTEQQYRIYIQSHVDKLFTKEGKYNGEAYDQFQADAGEFAMFLLELARVARRNKDNADKVYEYMYTLSNTNTASGEESTFCLDEKDVRRYRMKH